MPHSRVLIVRHGETNENVEGIIQGQLDTMLNEKGYDQARKTGSALQHEPLTRIISSPLKRTLHTAEEIAAHHSNVRVETDDRLMERCFGVLQGHVYRGPAEKPEDTVGIEPSHAYVLKPLTAASVNDLHHSGLICCVTCKQRRSLSCL